MVVAGLAYVRYAITNLSEAVPTTSSDARQLRQMRWAGALHRWTAQGVAFIQLREKQLPPGELYGLAAQGMELLRPSTAADRQHGRPRLLLNGRPDIAVAAGADGVHLTGAPGELTPAQARAVFAAAGLPCLVSVSCHTLGEVIAARDHGADLLLFAPVFGKQVKGSMVLPGQGLGALRRAADLARPVPLLALGGVTAENAPSCLEAGAAGVAAIRLFDPAPAAEAASLP